MLGFDTLALTPLMLRIINCLVLQPTAEERFAWGATRPKLVAGLALGGGGAAGLATVSAGRAIAMEAIEADRVPPLGVPALFAGGTPGVPAGGLEEPVVVPPGLLPPPVPPGVEPVGVPPPGVDPPAFVV